jgi:hypothetical protein
MYETVTAGTLFLGILAMLFAQYNVKFDRKVAGYFLKAMIVLYIISAISFFIDPTANDLMPHFKSGKSLMCKDDIISIKDGWTSKDDDYLTKDKKIYYIKMCRKL